MAFALGGRDAELLSGNLHIEWTGIRQGQGGGKVDWERLTLSHGGRDGRQRRRGLRWSNHFLVADLPD